MWKIKTLSIITVILGIISLGVIIYDYFALTEIVYNSGGPADLAAKQRIITLGFIPIVLFHVAFFGLVYMLFNYLKEQKILKQEYIKLKAESDKLKSETGKIIPEKKKSLENE